MVCKTKQCEKGFTLIEIAIVFVIFGFIFTPLVAIIVQQDLQKKSRDNLGGNERAVTAINFFLKQNGRYPCPADPALAPGDLNFGVEDCAAGGQIQIVNVATLPAAIQMPTLSAAPQTNQIFTGALPTRSLGLPFHAAANEDGWKHLYAVTVDLSMSPPLPGQVFDSIGDVFVIDNPIPSPLPPGTPPIPATNVHFAVVNMGKDGKGAYPLSPRAGIGAPDIGCGASLDSENCNGDVLFLDLNQTRETDNINDPNHYDDSLAYNNVNEKSDFWVLKNAGGRIEVANRTLGNVGFGVPAPASKLAVGGDVMIEGGATGGRVDVTSDVTVGGDAEVDNLLVLNSNAEFIAEGFCSNGRGYNAGVTYECCPNGSSLYYNATGDATSPTVLNCGPLPAIPACAADGAVYDGATCCSIADHNGGTAGSC